MGIKGSISVAHSLTAHSASIPKCNDGVLPCALVHTSTHNVVVCGVLYVVQVLPCSESNVTFVLACWYERRAHKYKNTHTPIKLLSVHTHTKHVHAHIHTRTQTVTQTHTHTHTHTYTVWPACSATNTSFHTHRNTREEAKECYSLTRIKRTHGDPNTALRFTFLVV